MLPFLPQSVASSAFRNALALCYRAARMSTNLSSTGISQLSCSVHRRHFYLCSISVLYQSALGSVHWARKQGLHTCFTAVNVFEPL